MTDAEAIKSKIDIVDFVSQYISLKKAGRNFKAVCPFHSEKTPSFIVSPERQTWHCFGACSEGGDAIKFLQKWENLDFLEALKILAKKTGVTLTSFTPSDDSRFKDKLYEINHLAAEFYHYLLISHPHGKKAREYLHNRRIREETIKTFMLGYAPNSWDSLLKFLTKKGYDPKDIHTAGLLIKTDKGRYYDRFRGRLMFILKDHHGNSIGFSGRTLPSPNEKAMPAGRQEAKYINTNDTPVYIKGNVLYGLDITREAIKKNKEAVVVEGEFDFLSSFQTGVSNVVAIKGTALTEGQILLLKRYTENLILSLDSDFAGSEAVKRGIDAAENANLTVRVITLPYGKDPAECIDKDPNLWKEAVKKARPVYDFIIDNAFDKYGQEGVIGKNKISVSVIPYLNKITNPIIVSHYVRKLAKMLSVNEESIELAMSKFKKEERYSLPLATDQITRTSRERLLEEYLLALVLQSDNVKQSLEEATEMMSFADLSELAIKQIFEKLKLYLSTNQFKVKEFADSLSEELLPAFDRAYISDIESTVKNKDKHKKEIITTAKEIVKLSLRRRIKDITTKIGQSEGKGEEKSNLELQENLKSLLSRLNQIDKSTQTN